MPNALKNGLNKNIGVLLFGRKRPGFDQEWSSSIRERAVAALEQLGFNCVRAEAPVLDDATIHAALDKIDAANCAALVVIQPSIADGQYALTVAQRWAGPVVLWATPERPGDGKVSSCSLVGQHLWASIFRQANRAFEFVYADPGEAHEDLLRAILLTAAVVHLRTAKVGVVGTHVPGFVDLAADPFLIHKTFGLQMHSLSLPQFIERVGGIAEEAVAQDLDEVRKLALPPSDPKQQPASDALLASSSRFYLSMKELMQEMGLDALALQCWPELPNTVGHWPYLAVSRLSAEGAALSIEGDVDGAIGSLVGALLGFGPGFLTDWLEHDASSILFWHPGMAPLDMCNSIGCEDGPTIGDHFNGARPMVLDGPLRTDGSVTISRLWRCDGRYHMTAFEGRTMPPRRRLSGNTLLVEIVGEPVPQIFDRLIHAGMPHHVLIHFGSRAETFRRLARLLGIEWHA
ncbi:MAG: L-fucose/L-arabinose isomerase family protein [Acidobacteriaceae bacterium]